MERRAVGRSPRGAGSPSLVEASYEDEEGRQWAVLVPQGDERPEMGIPVGPPDVTEVFPDLPEGIAVRLHNELFRRHLFTMKDIQGHGARELRAALQAAYQFDVAALTGIYRDGRSGR